MMNKTEIIKYLSFLITSAYGICLFVFINASQSFVAAQILNIPKEILGSTIGTITFYDQLLSLFLVFCWGVASDFTGRAFVYSCAFVFMGISLIVIPFSLNFVQLLLFRLNSLSVVRQVLQ